MEDNEIKIDLPEFDLDELQPDNTDLGTFKSVKTLKDAYDCLRKSFTKNAMELSKIKKEQANTTQNRRNIPQNTEKQAKNDEILQKNDKNDLKTDNLNGFTDEILKSDEPLVAENQSDKVQTPDDVADKVSNTPAKIWESASWNENVRNFFNNNSKAKNYVKEIGKVLVQDKVVRDSLDPLQQAWIKVLENKVDENAINNADLEEIVMKNEKIKQKVIQEYLNSLKSKKSAPAVISKTVNSGSEIIAEPKKQALSMTEAKEMAKKLLMK